MRVAPCPRCGGSGHIRDTESSALQILRVIQEESLKDSTAAVLVQVPVEVVRKNGDHVADMFWFVVCNRLDTLELDLLRPPVNDSGRYRGGGGTSRIVFNRSRIGNHHVWIDKRVIGGFIWVSDAFHDAALTAGLIGLDLKPRETV